VIPLNLEDIVVGAVATARLRRCKIKQRDYYGSSDRRERKTFATTVVKIAKVEWASFAILRADLQLVIAYASAKFWKMSSCPPTPIVALQTQPKLRRCERKLLLLSLKHQRSDGEHCIIIESLDEMAKGATPISKASGL
jgi:hypothetical protein